MNDQPDNNTDGTDVQPGGGDQPTAIGDFVWFDANHNGLDDPGEQPIPGVTVRLLDANGDPVLDDAMQPITTVTDASGEYHFSLVPNTPYKVAFDPSTADTSLLPGSPSPTELASHDSAEDSDAGSV